MLHSPRPRAKAIIGKEPGLNLPTDPGEPFRKAGGKWSSSLELANAIFKSCSSLLILGLGPNPQLFYIRTGTTQVKQLARWEHKPTHQQVNSSSETPWTFLWDLTPLTNGQYQLWDSLVSQPAMSGTGQLNRRPTLDWDLQLYHHALRTLLHTLVHQD